MDLKPYNTFGVSVQATNFSTVKEISEIPVNSPNLLVLGEGANILFTKDIGTAVVKNELKGKQIVEENKESTTIEIASGENWHDFVMWSVEQNLSGIENLALIPGTLGAAAVGNIAAYGQNFGDTVKSVTVLDLKTGEEKTIPNLACNFTYRNSSLKKDVFVTSITVKLSKLAKFDTNYFGSKPYESLKSELSDPPYTPKMIAEAVIRLRTKKLPDWHKIGTAGSFFKNPFVSKERFEELKKQMPDLQPYPVDKMLYPNPNDPVFKISNMVKIPAGKLLEKLGWLGKRTGNVGTFEKHALIVVNYGGATGMEILEFTQKMQEDIRSNFEIELDPEVKII